MLLFVGGMEDVPTCIPVLCTKDCDGNTVNVNPNCCDGKTQEHVIDVINGF